MFKFLKDKLKDAVSLFSKKVEKEAEEVEEKPEIKEEPKKSAKPAKKEKEAKKEKPKQKKEKKEKKKAVEKETREEKREEAEEKKEIRKGKEEEPKEETTREKAEEISEEEEEREEKEEEKPKEEKKGFFERLKERFTKKEEAPKKEETEAEEKKKITEEKEEKEKKKEEISEEKPEKEAREEEKAEKAEEEEEEEPKEEKKGFFERLKESVTKKVLSEEKFEELFWGLEMAMLENNVAVEVIEKIKTDLKETIVNKKIPRGDIEGTIKETLKKSIVGLFDTTKIRLIEQIKGKKEKPFVIAFVGVNGGGKTTTIAKIAHMLKEQGLKCVLAASDTFRAAAIQQLEEHAERLEVKVIKHDYGADPAAVAFDAIKYAKAKSLDVVLVDTAGRLHSNTNLVDEMKKIIRVTKPDLKIFVGESITGNDCVEQARQFNEAVNFDGIILTKADVDEKGGAAISVSYITNKPIIYFGTGQKYSDLKEFSKEAVMENIGL